MAEPVPELVRSESAGPVSESARAAPAAPLRGLIGWYSGYRQDGVPPARHRGLPSPYLTLIITLDDPLTVARHPDPADRPGDYRTLLGGLHTTPALITHPGGSPGCRSQLSPLGARALLGLPAGELAGRDLAADDVLGRVAGELHERMRAAADWPARFAILDQLLLDRADLDQQVTPDIAEAWRRLLRSGGQVRAGRPGRPGRLEPAVPAAAAAGRDRADPEGRGPGDPVRPGPPDPAAPGRGGRRGGRRRRGGDAG